MKFLAPLLCAILLLSSCKYSLSFKGTSIDYNVTKTFTVQNFGLNAPGAPALLNQRFAESLRDRVRNNTRLTPAQQDGDIVMSGSISQFNIQAVAATASGTNISAPSQQLNIGITVNFENKKDPKQNFSQTFIQPVYFPQGQDFSTVQNALTTEAFDGILDQVFNKAFTNW